jgi:hypothetical protein
MDVAGRLHPIPMAANPRLETFGKRMDGLWLWIENIFR